MTAAARPSGMTSWSPQTGSYENSLFYDYSADSLTGIRATHQASVWMSDYGDFSLMPVTGDPGFLPHQRASDFSHERESSRPQSYAVDLPTEARLQALTTTSAGGTPDNFRSYLIAQFDRAPSIGARGRTVPPIRGRLTVKATTPVPGYVSPVCARPRW